MADEPTDKSFGPAVLQAMRVDGHAPHRCTNPGARLFAGWANHEVATKLLSGKPRLGTTAARLAMRRATVARMGRSRVLEAQPAKPEPGTQARRQSAEPSETGRGT